MPNQGPNLLTFILSRHFLQLCLSFTQLLKHCINTYIMSFYSAWVLVNL